MRTVTAGQQAELDAVSTRPIYLVQLDIAGTELLSSSGDQVYDDKTWTGGDVSVIGLNDWHDADLTLIPTTTRVAQAMSGTAIRAACSIWLYPYPETPILLLGGIVTAVDISDRVRYSISHRATAGRWTPRIRCSSTWLNHLPQPGTRFLWQGDTYILE